MSNRTVSTPAPPPASSEPRPSIQEGDVIQGKYRVMRVLGRGGMGVVVAAEHLQLRETVALKFLTKREDGDLKEFQSRFQREARITAKLRGEHVVRTLDFGLLEDGTPFMVMEFLEGVDLRQILRTQGPFPLERALHYMIQVCEGLAEAHGLGIVHRDLKPSNLFLTTSPDGSELIKVLDFGVSKLASLQEEGDEPLTATGVLLGSPRYMSPEQLQSQTEQVDMRSDVWALGTILYELLVGQPVFPGSAAPAICAQILGDKPLPRVKASRPEIPEAIDTILAGCLERNPAHRTPNVAVLAGQLLGVLGVPAEQLVARLSAMIERRSGTPGGGATLLSGSYPSISTLSFEGLGRSSSAPSSSSRVILSSPSMPTVAEGATFSSPPPAMPKAIPKSAPWIVLTVAGAALLGGAYWFQRSPSTPSAPTLSGMISSPVQPAPISSSPPPDPTLSAAAVPPLASSKATLETPPSKTADPPGKDPKTIRPPPPRPPPSGKSNVLDERL
ncbi:MAG: serine/threonine-protein kinase [Myxococcales bacterium]|nr:serine/threonine protein kinase [Polyangiaceae bacterium]MDW8248748.1 serine/threonine-protein kinase [Myxococcales bacterium]